MSRIASYTIVKPIYFTVKLLSDIIAVCRFGKRSPEHILSLARRTGETCKVVFDKFTFVKSSGSPQLQPIKKILPRNGEPDPDDHK